MIFALPYASRCTQLVSHVSRPYRPGCPETIRAHTWTSMTTALFGSQASAARSPSAIVAETCPHDSRPEAPQWSNLLPEGLGASRGVVSLRRSTAFGMTFAVRSLPTTPAASNHTHPSHGHRRVWQRALLVDLCELTDLELAQCYRLHFRPAAFATVVMRRLLEWRAFARGCVLWPGGGGMPRYTRLFPLLTAPRAACHTGAARVAHADVVFSL